MNIFLDHMLEKLEPTVLKTNNSIVTGFNNFNTPNSPLARALGCHCLPHGTAVIASQLPLPRL